MNRAVVPVATMLAIQVMISLSVLSLSVMMPAVAADLAIDPKLVGVFTAIIYGVAAVTALAAGRVAHLPGRAPDGGDRARLQCAVYGRGDRDRRDLHRCGARPDQPRLGARAGAARAARVVGHGVFAEADRRAHRR